MRVVRLAPVSETQEYSYGEILVRDVQGDAEVVVSYHDASPKYLVFNMMIENRGSSAITFDPATCILVPDTGPVRQAIDPEVQLLSMDVRNLKRIRRGEALTYVGGGLLVASLAWDYASLIGEESAAGLTGVQEFARVVTNNGSFVVLQAADATTSIAARITDDEVPVPENRRFWIDHALRITTIQPGELARGKIVFERNDAASLLNFQVEVAGNNFNIPFRQLLFTGEQKE